MLGRLAAGVALVLALATGSAAQTGSPAPAPARPTVEKFAAGPNIVNVELSRSGRYVAIVRTTVGAEFDTDELIIFDRLENTSRVVTRAREEVGVQISWVSWKSDDMLLLGTSNRLRLDGNTYWVPRVMTMARTGGEQVLLFEDQASRLAVKFAPIQLSSALPHDPDHVLLEAWGPSGNALWRANVRTGRVERIDTGRWDTVRWIEDVNGYPVLRVDELPRSTGLRFLRRAPGARDWTQFLEFKRQAGSEGKEFIPFGHTDKPGEIFVAARRDGDDLTGVHTLNTATGVLGDRIGGHEKADVDGALIHPQTHQLLAVCADVKRYECLGLDRQITRHLGAVDAFFERNARVEVVGASDDHKVWLLHVEQAAHAPGYFLFDREAVKIDPLIVTHPSLDGLALAPVTVVSYKARDGADLWGYLTNGAGEGRPPKALIVMPHGGPESRDASGFGDWAQFLASRGYAVFQPNFRGGEGFGRAFAQAGYGQWGRRMQDDVTDGVKHLVDTKQADPARICIFGWSYGGYAALAGGALTPDLYRCIISGAGISDLVKLIEYERAQSGRGSAGYAYILKAVGDPARDRAALEAASPRRLAASFRAPVLLLHGQDDGIVEVEQSQLMERALNDAGKPVKLVIYPKEGHSPGFWERENRVAYLKELETFLAQHLPAN